MEPEEDPRDIFVEEIKEQHKDNISYLESNEFTADIHALGEIIPSKWNKLTFYKMRTKIQPLIRISLFKNKQVGGVLHLTYSLATVLENEQAQVERDLQDSYNQLVEAAIALNNAIENQRQGLNDKLKIAVPKEVTLQDDKLFDFSVEFYAGEITTQENMTFSPRIGDPSTHVKIQGLHALPQSMYLPKRDLIELITSGDVSISFDSGRSATELIVEPGDYSAAQVNSFLSEANNNLHEVRRAGFSSFIKNPLE